MLNPLGFTQWSPYHEVYNVTFSMHVLWWSSDNNEPKRARFLTSCGFHSSVNTLPGRWIWNSSTKTAATRVHLKNLSTKLFVEFCLLGLMASLSQNPSLWRAGLGGALQCKSTRGRWEMSHVHQGGPSAWTPHLLCTQVSGSTLVSGRLKLELGSWTRVGQLFVFVNESKNLQVQAFENRQSRVSRTSDFFGRVFTTLWPQFF
jgi:hypothetical protein